MSDFDHPADDFSRKQFCVRILSVIFFYTFHSHSYFVVTLYFIILLCTLYHFNYSCMRSSFSVTTIFCFWQLAMSNFFPFKSVPLCNWFKHIIYILQKCNFSRMYIAKALMPYIKPEVLTYFRPICFYYYRIWLRTL